MGDGGTVRENEKQCFVFFLLKNMLVLIKVFPWQAGSTAAQSGVVKLCY